MTKTYSHRRNKRYRTFVSHVSKDYFDRKRFIFSLATFVIVVVVASIKCRMSACNKRKIISWGNILNKFNIQHRIPNKV